MVAAGNRVLVAASGGPDSTALLHVLSELAWVYGFDVEAAHFNHNLRGADSASDQQLAERLCASLGVPCHLGTAALSDSAGNLEEEARTQRYRFLLRTARERRCTRIATGHTSDDQAETVLMRLLRGSGVDGLAGIRAVRGDGVIRPLIECERAEVLAYLEERGIPFASDRMNVDPRFLRTRVRHEVLPMLRRLNPRLSRTLTRTARVAAADADLLGALAREAAGLDASDEGVLVLGPLDSLPKGLKQRVVRHWLETRRGTLRGVSSVHLWAVYRLAARAGPTRRVDLPGDGSVLRELGTLRFCRAGGVAVDGCRRQAVATGVPMRLSWGWQVLAELRGTPAEIPPGERHHWCFWADADTVGGALQFRGAAPGDRIGPLGVSGHRKLQDVFVDGKVPRRERWGRPVLEVEQRLLWVPGLVRSRHALITAATRLAWRVVIEPLPVAGA